MLMRAPVLWVRSVLCARLRCVPSPGRLWNEDNASNTSPEHVSQLLVSQERLLLGVNSV